MDQSEEIPQQQYIAGGAGQMATIPPPFTHTPDAAATDVGVPVFSTMQPPHPPPVSSSQHQLANQEAQGHHLQHVRERLRQFWDNQMQEMKAEDFKKHSLPISPIKRIMKADGDVRMIAKETPAVFAKACEMLILDLTSQAWINTEQDGRRIVSNKDIAAVISKTDLYDFLGDVIPRDLKEQISKETNSRQQVPQQHGEGSSSGTNAGGQHPPAFTPLYQSGPQNQQPFVPSVPWPQTQNQQNQQQPSMPWPRAQYQQNHQQPFMSWSSEQLPMPWLQDEDELMPDQENPEQVLPSSSQDEQMPDQQHNDN